jgi:glycosyltransferase involved in cell wall biosynthesis
VRAVVCLEHGPLVTRLTEQGHRVDVIPTSARAIGIVAAAVRLRALLARQQPDVLHANGVKAALVSAMATTGMRLPLLWVKHDFSYDGWPARLIAARCSAVIGVSGAVTTTFRGRTLDKVHVVHNGIAPPEVDRRRGRSLLLEMLPASATRVIALVGRLDPLKGARELLAVLPSLQEQIAEIHAVFIGGPDRAHPGFGERLRREVEDAGLGNVVTFLGHQDDVLMLLAGCDVAVIASRPDCAGADLEGFPYVALEALAVGTPVAAYATGGVPELLGDCGLLVPSGDRKALAAAIARLLTDEPLWERLSRAGRTRVHTRFSLARFVAEMDQRYHESVTE